MPKSADAFRTISEVADWLGVQSHVLRFWESKFAQVKPVKRAGGRRYYRPADMLLLGGIKKLLHEDGLTIKGAQKLIREQGVTEVSSFSQPLESGPSETFDAEPAGSTILRFKGHEDEAVGDTAEAAGAEPVEEPAMPVETAPLDTDTPSAPLDSPSAPPGPDMEIEATAPEGHSARISLDADPAEVPDAPETPDMPVAASAEPEVDAPQAPVSPAEAAGEEPAARLPSFLHRPAARAMEPGAPPESPASEDSPAAPEIQAAEPGSAPADSPPASKRARVVEVPDPPPDSEIGAVPGLLGRLATLPALTPGQAAEIAPVAAELKAWLERQGQARAG